MEEVLAEFRNIYYYHEDEKNIFGSPCLMGRIYTEEGSIWPIYNYRELPDKETWGYIFNPLLNKEGDKLPINF